MSQLQEIQNSIFESLEVLSFNEYAANRKECKNFILKRELFGKPDQKAFEIIMIFLVKCLKNSQALAQYRHCYPCLDKSQEVQFRKVTIDFLKSLEKIDSGLKFTPIYAVQPGGEAFCSYLLNLINFTMTKVLKDKYATEIEPDLNDTTLAERNEKELIKLSDLKAVYGDLDTKMSSEMEYFELRKRSLEKEWDSVCLECEKIVNSVRVQILGVSNNSMKDNELVANFRQAVCDLNDQVVRKLAQLRQFFANISPKLEIYNYPSETSSQTLDLRPLSKECDLEKYFSRGCLNLELVKKEMKKFIEEFDAAMRNWTSVDELKNLPSHFKFFNQEIDKLVKTIREKMSTLRSVKESLSETTDLKRQQLLSTPQVQERRKWFSSKVPSTFPKIKFVFGDISRVNLTDSCTDSDFMDSPITDKTPPTIPYNRFSRNFEWSFHPMDISRFSYVAPTAPERPILSPLKEEL